MELLLQVVFGVIIVMNVVFIITEYKIKNQKKIKIVRLP